MRWHLDIKLQVALVHLPRDHALDDVHGHQLVALVGGAKDVVRVTFLDLYIQEPEIKRQGSI